MDFFLYSELLHKKWIVIIVIHRNGHLNMEDAVYDVCMSEC